MCPNWCSNDLYVEGSKESIDAFQALLKTGEGDFDFNLFIPYPSKYEELDMLREQAEKDGVEWDKLPKDGYNQGGYDWCIENWGTKWNAYEASIERTSDESMSGWFDTAWSPPLGVLQAMSEMFPTLSFTLSYEEGGMCLAGNSTYKNGIEVEADEWEIEEGEEE